MDIYNEIIPNENFGGEYTALRWICMLWLFPDEAGSKFLSHPEVESWYELLSQNDFEKLREYINYKYHFKDIMVGDSQTPRNLRFLEDFILFQNPDRERWESSFEYLRGLRIPVGARVADLGCGPGYFTFKFADIVGETGHVYAIETNPLHLDYLNKYVRKYDIKNVEIITGSTKGTGLEPGVKVDILFMCSLYHIIYAAFTEEERVEFIRGIRDCLAENGRLIVVDNGLVTESELPYHGPYIDRSLVISQLYYYGFSLLDSYQFSPQRYALTFSPGSVPAPQETAYMPDIDSVAVTNAASLINYRIADAAPTAGYTARGRAAAELFLNALENQSEASASRALAAYGELIPLERIGDEYTAFEWFCEYLLAGGETRKTMLADPLTRSFFNLLGSNNFKLLKEYVKTKYELPGHSGLENLTQISEYITFNNPNRDSWEKTNQMLKHLNIRQGEHIADIGCGSGFFTYHFARAAGEKGSVYATEINRDALVYVEELRERLGLNIKTVISRLNDVCLPENSADTIFMCSMYHAVYIASIEFVKDAFIESLKKALRPGGRLVIVDNEISPPGEPAYFGSAIAKELVISQLKYYGFRLRDCKHFIPQRYIMTFETEEGK